MTYRSTKTYGHEVGLSCAFRQWRADSHCKLLHGYALSVKLEFEAETLDARNWVMDFGSLKPVKEMLQKYFDHTTIIAEDDPCLDDIVMLGGMGVLDPIVLPRVGCEAFAEFIFDMVNLWIIQTSGQHPRVRLSSVEVREHGANSAIYERNW